MKHRYPASNKYKCTNQANCLMEWPDTLIGFQKMFVHRLEIKLMRNCTWIQFIYTTRNQELNTMSTFWAFASWRQRWAISSTWEGHRRSKCETLTTSSFLSKGSRRHVMADSLIVVTGPYNTGTLNTKFSENKGF